MKKLLIAATVAAISSGALAADLKPYIEGQLGYANLNDVDTKTLNVNGTNFRAAAKLNMKYDSDATYGGEIGLSDFLMPNFRIGASYSRSEFNFKNANLSASGTATINGVNYAGAGTANVTRADMGNLAGQVDAKLNLYMLNAYYDFKNSSQFTPFVGVGIGLADIKNTKDNEFAYSASAGGKYNINNNLYLGVKGSYVRVNSPTVRVDSVDVALEDVDLWKAEALLGYQF
jgi:opacity protein-like surface antigen